MCPEYAGAIDAIVEFWSDFSESQLRSLYNYTKHKGVLLYKEIEALDNIRIWNYYVGKMQLPSDISDVRKEISLLDSIQELIDFDDNELFPYISKLIDELRKAVRPSSMIKC